LAIVDFGSRSIPNPKPVSCDFHSRDIKIEAIGEKVEDESKSVSMSSDKLT
jgi:hypothetical protein